MFSSRLPSTLSTNRLTSALARRRASGQAVIDLTVTNPTAVGLLADAETLAALGTPASRVYRPEAFGLREAREAVAARLAERRDAPPSIARLALTASTSEAYSVLFKLLCDGGDEVLVPQPSYPLFEHLAALDLVRPVPYHLEYHGRWSIDLASLDAAWSDRTRGVIVVSPNNPTGSYLREADWQALDARCAARGAAVVVDEVFAEFPLEPFDDAVRGVLGGTAPQSLVFALDGLSKSCGLPQVKVGWIECDGPPALVDAACARLELVLDTYLSVGTPAQVALAGLLASGRQLGDRIRERLRVNLEAARRVVAAVPSCTLLRAEGGWSVVVRVPAVSGEEALVLGLLEGEGVLVHPGYFFDFPREAYLVVSLLPKPGDFETGLARVVSRAGIA